MRKSKSQCKHTVTDKYGICAICGTLTKPFPYRLYITYNVLLQAEKDSGIISEADYRERKAKLDFVREYSMLNHLWHPYSMDIS
jgi:hypothetical protein